MNLAGSANARHERRCAAERLGTRWLSPGARQLLGEELQGGRGLGLLLTAQFDASRPARMALDSTKDRDALTRVTGRPGAHHPYRMISRDRVLLRVTLQMKPPLSRRVEVGAARPSGRVIPP